jgi:uncharacterized protein YdaU (DUF1376 family)
MSRPSRTNTTNPVRPFRFAITLAPLAMETQHLTPEAFGCLIRLMFAYWSSGPAKDDNRVLARLVGLTPGGWKAIRPEVEEFFDIDGGRWINWRLDEEIQAAYDAINRNHARTRAATEARKRKRGEQRDVARNDERDVTRDDVRYVVPIESKHATPQSSAIWADRKAPSQGDESLSFEDDVAAAERSFLGGAQ